MHGARCALQSARKNAILHNRTRFEYREMIVGVVKAQLHMQGIGSLKGKRSIVKSLIGRLKSRFNISIAEVDHQDNKTSAVIAVVMVSNDARFIDQQLDAVIGFMQKDGRFYLGEIERETF
jgi:uncharacterized protein YlxP (DUF503 family)